MDYRTYSRLSNVRTHLFSVQDNTYKKTEFSEKSSLKKRKCLNYLTDIAATQGNNPPWSQARAIQEFLFGFKWKSSFFV